MITSGIVPASLLLFVRLCSALSPGSKSVLSLEFQEISFCTQSWLLQCSQLLVWVARDLVRGGVIPGSSLRYPSIGQDLLSYKASLSLITAVGGGSDASVPEALEGPLEAGLASCTCVCHTGLHMRMSQCCLQVKA